MRSLGSRTGGRLLAAGGIVYFLLQWSATTIAPSWYEDSPLSGFWPAALGLHALAIILIIAGMYLIGLDLHRRGEASPLWWVALGLTFLGLTVGHPLLVAGLILLGTIEFRAHGRRLVPALLAGGGLLWLYVFLAGAHLGDENSRPPAGLERWAALVGLISMCAGLVGLGWAYAHTPEEDSVEVSPVASI